MISNDLVFANLKASVHEIQVLILTISWSQITTLHETGQTACALRATQPEYPLMTVPRCGCVGKKLNGHGNSYFLAYSTFGPFHLRLPKLMISVYFRAHSGEKERRCSFQ